MERVKSLRFPNKMKFPDYVLDLSMPGGGKEGVIKQKLKNILAAKLSGTESALSDFFFVGNTGESFDAEPSWIEHGTGSDGWNYYHLMGLSGDYGEYETEIWRDQGHECNASLWLTLLSFGEYSGFIAKPELKFSDLDNLLADYTCFWLDYDIEPSCVEAEEIMMDFYNALLDIRHGKAKENNEVENFIEGLVDCYGGAFSFDTILNNLEFFTDCLSCGNADHTIKTVVVSSSELYHFKRYRERVPEDVRHDFENALQILVNPLPCCTTVWEDNEDEGFSAIAFRFEDDSDYADDVQSTLAAHPLFTEALHFLIDNLPILRKEYGDASASPVLFFALFAKILVYFHAIFSCLRIVLFTCKTGIFIVLLPYILFSDLFLIRRDLSGGFQNLGRTSV